MSHSPPTPLYPLRFEPLFKAMLWGGRRLPDFLGRPAPHEHPIGEAWVLSDVDGSQTMVANGPLKGTTLRELIGSHPRELFGAHPPADGRFPLLLKFIDARQELSVQVHPNDEQAARLKGPGARGKTEAWFVLDADPATSALYAGFRPGTTADTFREAMAAGTAHHTLHRFTPVRGDCLFLEAGTVHAIGANVLLFEVQQTSDITYRLYDWDRVDAQTGRPRQLHVEEGLLCADFARGPLHPVRGVNERLVACEHFTLHGRTADRPLTVGKDGECRAVVCVGGAGTVAGEPVRTGDVLLLPASVGAVEAHPDGELHLLECGMGERGR